MNRRNLFLAGLLLLAVCAVAKPGIQFAECYLSYDTRNGDTELILYDYQADNKKDLTKEGFSKALGLSEFEIKDVMFTQGGYPPAMKVLARAKNFMMNTPVEQLFSALTDQKCSVKLEMMPPSMQMSVVVPESKRFYVGNNNTVQQLRNEKDRKILLVFDVSTDPISVVFGWKQKETVSEKMDRGYQHDADIFRLRHAAYYGTLISEFHEKTGRYPLQGKADCPNYVHLATSDQEQYVQGTPPIKHVVTPVEDFRADLENGLGRKVDLKFDPQKAPSGGPVFYIYMMNGDRYYFAVHLYNAQPFSNPLDKHYNKLEITNGPTGRRGLWNVDDLMKDDAFESAVAENPTKPDFFEALEKEYR